MRGGECEALDTCGTSRHPAAKKKKSQSTQISFSLRLSNYPLMNTNKYLPPQGVQIHSEVEYLLAFLLISLFVINFPQRPERMFSILYSLCFLCNERKEHLTGFDHILELELLCSNFALFRAACSNWLNSERVNECLELCCTFFHSPTGRYSLEKVTHEISLALFILSVIELTGWRRLFKSNITLHFLHVSHFGVCSAAHGWRDALFQMAFLMWACCLVAFANIQSWDHRMM